MKWNIAIVLSLLTACGTETRPKMTWLDAERVWAEAWCDLAARCSPSTYESVGGDAGCEQYVLDVNCDGTQSDLDCNLIFPERNVQYLDECRDDMAVLDCHAYVAPDSCYRAYTH